MKTRITEMFGVETPIVMGGMTGVGYGELVTPARNFASKGGGRAREKCPPNRFKRARFSANHLIYWDFL